MHHSRHPKCDRYQLPLPVALQRVTLMRSRSAWCQGPNGLWAACLVVVAITACQSGGEQGSDTSVSVQDSIATVGELHASLEGGRAPGKQAYTYRGLYAGMPRAALQSLVAGRVAVGASPCTAAAKGIADTTCTYKTVLGPDAAPVTVAATFTIEPHTAMWLAREITVVRDLPIAVDGVRVAKGLSDAFAEQTVLLDSRDASYGHHTAVIRMGTIRTDRQNFATVIVAPKEGREELTVTLSRSGAAPPPVRAPQRTSRPKP